MSNQTLNRMGNTSAGNKEENIFKVFAYLNTRKEFNPMLISTRVLVKPATIADYLDQIMKAQLFTEEFRDRIAKPFAEQSFGNATGEQKELALKVLSKYQAEAAKVDKNWKSKNTQLLQYVLPGDDSSKDVFYNRLEQSLLIFEWLKKKK